MRRVPSPSILIELNAQLEVDRGLIPLLEGVGFTLVERVRSPLVTAESLQQSVYNYIFRR